MGHDAVRLQAASALEVIIHVGRTGKRRYVSSIGILEESETGLTVSIALEATGGDRPGLSVRPGPGWPKLADRLGLDSAVGGVEA